MSPKYRTVEKEDGVNTAKRVFAVGAIFACAFGILICRAVSFHMKDNAEIEKVALRQYRTAVQKSTQRGKILDTAGRELAIDVTVNSIYANPREIDDAVNVSMRLAKLLKMGNSRLLEKLSSGRKFVWVKRRVSEKEAKAVRESELKGVYLMRENSRLYPGENLASSVLGAVGFDSEPLGGVELYYNDAIAVSKRLGDLSRDARGHLYLSAVSAGKDSEAMNIELTLDRTLQYIAEKELGLAVEGAHAVGGSVVIVDVKSGALLAMANMPTFNPNAYARFQMSNWRNRAVSDSYEPGSTFKAVIIAAALDGGFVTPEDVFDCENGSVRIGVKTVHDAHPHGKLSVADIVKVSSNIGAYKIEKRLGINRTHEAIRLFGFGQATGIDLPGESGGILSPSGSWSDLQFATIAFGQGVAATPLQMTMAFAAIANGGVLMRPYIVKRITNEKGETLMNRQAEIAGRPISSMTAKIMTELLSKVTQKGGTGLLAASSEYEAAGKTGTAQKANPRTGGYVRGKYYSSFVGFAPKDDPRIAVFVGIDEPRGAYYGGQIAAPVFRKIVDATLHYLKVPGALVAERQGDDAAKSTIVTIADTAEFDEPKTIARNETGAWVLPDLGGMTMRGVLEASKDSNILWKFFGSGIAVRQNPGPGLLINPGEECTVEFE